MAVKCIHINSIKRAIIFLCTRRLRVWRVARMTTLQLLDSTLQLFLISIQRRPWSSKKVTPTLMQFWVSRRKKKFPIAIEVSTLSEHPNQSSLPWSRYTHTNTLPVPLSLSFPLIFPSLLLPLLALSLSSHRKISIQQWIRIKNRSPLHSCNISYSRHCDHSQSNAS